MKNDPLNKALTQWADEHRAGQQELNELGERVRARLSDCKAKLPVDQETAKREPWRSRVLWMVAGAAALVLLQFSITHLSTPRPTDDQLLALLRRSAAGGTDTTQLFAEARQIFPRQVRWVSETRDTVHVEVADTPVKHIPSEYVEVRFVAVCREDDGVWRHVWHATVVSGGEDMISLEIPGRGQLALWAKQIDDRLIAADTQITLHSPDTRATVSRALAPGVPEQCLSVKNAGQEFRVYQVVRPVASIAAAPQA